MKNVLKPAAIGLGVLWLIWMMALLYWMVAPRVFGPEREVNALHAAIKPGMPVEEFRALLRQNVEINTTPDDAGGELHVSKLTGDWLCTFEVRITEETVGTVRDVICVD